MVTIEVKDITDKQTDQTTFDQLKSYSYEAVDQYATVCDKFVSMIFSAFKDGFQPVTQFTNGIVETVTSILTIPIAIGNFMIRALAFVFYVFTIPLRVVQAFTSNFPLFTVFILICLVIMYFVIRSITRQSVVQYFLHTIVPYTISILYTIISMIFPQVNTMSRILKALLHPIRWILGFVEQVDRRAVPIRRTVEIFSPPRTVTTSIEHQSSPDVTPHNTPSSSARSSPSKISPSDRITRRSLTEIRERANEDRVQCCVCFVRDKTIVLQPCHHLCLCEPCFKEVMKNSMRCPICRVYIDSHIAVYM